MLGLKLNHVSKRGYWCFFMVLGAANPVEWDTDNTLISKWIWMDGSAYFGGTWVLLYMPYRADSTFAPNKWETSLQSNAFSQWLGANLESSSLPYDGILSKDPVVTSNGCCRMISVVLTSTGGRGRLPHQHTGAGRLQEKKDILKFAGSFINTRRDTVAQPNLHTTRIGSCT